MPKTSDVSISRSRRQLLSPSERFIEEKRQELEFKREEASAKRKQLEKTSAKIRDEASTLRNTGQHCSNCHKEITQFAPAAWQNVNQCFSVES